MATMCGIETSGLFPDLDLLSFLLLVLIDNAAARREASGHTVPVIRSAYHIGSHYELFQAEGVNPTVFSYIVGDVTIKLARMLAQAEAGQVLIGDFNAALPDRPGLSDANGFVRAAIDELKELPKLNIAGSPLQGFELRSGSCGSSAPRAQRIVDKHGLEQTATNLEFSVRNGDETLLLGVPTQ